MATPGATSAVDALLIAFASLQPDEQAELHQRISDQQIATQAADDCEMDRNLRSLRRVAEVVGRVPSVDEYRIVSAELIEAGEDIEPYRRLYAYFGTWRRAREAFELAETTTPLRIEARFRARRLGKVHTYTEETLRETLQRCASEFGRAPRVNEFEWWRHKEIELAKAAGLELQLPSATPYRRRWGTWEAALRANGLDDDQVAGRLEA